MSKTIKVEERVYDKLTGLMRPKESYSQVVERVLNLFDKMGELRDVLEGQLKYSKFQREKETDKAEVPR